MKTHDGYTASEKGAKCSKCDEWIEPGENAVLLQPGVIEDNGHVHLTAVAMHGVLHKECFKEL